jgi:hypothetical protein
MGSLSRIWAALAGVLFGLGVYATSASANSFDQIELHSGSSSGPTWSGALVFSGTSAGYVFTMGIVQITCGFSTGAGTVNSADVGAMTSDVFRASTVVGCPGSGGTTWTVLPRLPWSIHQLYDQTTQQFVSIFDNVTLDLIDGIDCRYTGAGQAFSDIGQSSSILGSQTNPVGGFPGHLAFGRGSTPLIRISGTTLSCAATLNLQASYGETGAGGLNIWQRNQGARVQG